jgi:hypothetical protein
VRQPAAVVVVVHRVHEQQCEPFRVAGRALELHVVKLGRPAFPLAFRFLRGFNRVLFRHPRPRRVHLAQEIHHQVAFFYSPWVGTRYAKTLAVHGEHLGRGSRVVRQRPKRLRGGPGEVRVVQRTDDTVALQRLRQVLRGEGQGKSTRGVDGQRPV